MQSPGASARFSDDVMDRMASGMTVAGVRVVSAETPAERAWREQRVQRLTYIVLLCCVKADSYPTKDSILTRWYRAVNILGSPISTSVAKGVAALLRDPDDITRFLRTSQEAGDVWAEDYEGGSGAISMTEQGIEKIRVCAGELAQYMEPLVNDLAQPYSTIVRWEPYARDLLKDLQDGAKRQRDVEAEELKRQQEAELQRQEDERRRAEREAERERARLAAWRVRQERDQAERAVRVAAEARRVYLEETDFDALPAVREHRDATDTDSLLDGLFV